MPVDPMKLADRLTIVDYCLAIICTVVGVTLLLHNGSPQAWFWLACGAIGFLLAKIKPAKWVVQKVMASIIVRQPSSRTKQ